MTKYSFKRIIKTKVKEAALSFLMQKKKGHSKLNNLIYTTLKMQPYFKSKRLNANQVKQLFRFRTRMSNIKANFKSKYTKIGYLCPLKCGQYEDDQHLLKCSKTAIYRSILLLESKVTIQRKNKCIAQHRTRNIIHSSVHLGLKGLLHSIPLLSHLGNLIDGCNCLP